MAIHTDVERKMGGGFNKKLDDTGIMMIFDNLQRYQYQYPIKSTVRELLCNGIDSVAEKTVALNIISGKNKVEDYFVDLDGDVYRDSHFDKDYYDINWLSDNDNVSITYITGAHMEKDRVVFSDNGVGIGANRLEKYFNLGFSTKRLSKLPLGKFGIGAKSPLSIGVDFYTMESRYNGRLFRFNIYAHTVDSIIPATKEDGIANEFIWFSEGTPDAYQVFYESTEQKNGVTITLEAKKHHKTQYVDAVKSQMLYFQNIQFNIIEENQSITEVDYKAKILYEDEYIVLSDNNYFSKPHLLLNKVNYGYVDWSELELEDKKGNIGIKVAPEMVDINPSRESVLWSENTKAMVLKRFNEVVDITSKLIQEELMEPDFLKWLRTCYSVTSYYRERTDIVGKLAQIVDLGRAKLRFHPNPEVIFNAKDAKSDIPGIFMRGVRYESAKEDGILIKKISRYPIKFLNGSDNRPIFYKLKGERAENRKDKYLLILYPQGFVIINEPYSTEEEIHNTSITEMESSALLAGTLKTREMYWQLIQESELGLKYAEVEVPESFTGTDKDKEDKIETVEEAKQADVIRMNNQERRKLEGKTLVYSPMMVAPYGEEEKLRTHSFVKMEIPIKSINDFDSPEVYYGGGDTDDSLLSLAAMLTRDPHPDNLPGKDRRTHAINAVDWSGLKWYRINSNRIPSGVRPIEAFHMQHFFDGPHNGYPEVMLLKMSQANQKYYREFDHITKFFIQIKNNTITMGNTLIKWNTARQIRQRLTQAAFLYNFNDFLPEYTQLYQQLTDYVDTNYREVFKLAQDNSPVSSSSYGDLIAHLDNVQRFQEFVSSGHSQSTEEIAELAKELFGNPELRDGMAIDPAIMKIMDKVEELAKACGPLVNNLPVLTGYYIPTIPEYMPRQTRQLIAVPELLEFEIKAYLESKGIFEQFKPKTWLEGIEKSTLKELEEGLVEGILAGSPVEEKLLQPYSATEI